MRRVIAQTGRRLAPGILGVAALCLAGCLGPGPVERSLLVHAGCEQAAVKRADALIVAVQPFEAPAALERRAVAIREDGALRSATTWFWEDTPRKVFTQAVLDQLACNASWSVLWPYRPRAGHIAVLGGRIEDFSVELQEDAVVMHLSVLVELWGREKGPLLARLPVHATGRSAGRTPGAAAEAASLAMQDALATLSGFLETMRPQLQAASTPGEAP
ncbi:hypothetical protein [Megalodesulfovibrio paquesii]